ATAKPREAAKPAEAQARILVRIITVLGVIGKELRELIDHLQRVGVHQVEHPQFGDVVDRLIDLIDDVGNPVHHVFGRPDDEGVAAVVRHGDDAGIGGAGCGAAATVAASAETSSALTSDGAGEPTAAEPAAAEATAIEAAAASASLLLGGGK